MAVYNKSDEAVYVKPEDDTEAFVLPAGCAFSGGHDGVAIPSTGDVFKSPGKSLWGFWLGANTTIENGGKVSGWGQTKLPDDFPDKHPDWQDIFNAAKEIPDRFDATPPQPDESDDVYLMTPAADLDTPIDDFPTTADYPSSHDDTSHW